MTPYARTEITLILLIGGAITALVGIFFHWWATPLGLLTLALLLFYRNPPRKTTAGVDALIAPADGKIMRIIRDYDAPDCDVPQLRIIIFLSVFNVHMNRAPCGGRVTAVQHHAGKFLNALREDATDENDNTLVELEPVAPLPGPVFVRQIAGVLAKRVVCAVKPGDEVSAGEVYGMIKLGSQTEIRVPEDPNWELCVKPDQPVRAGLTVLARYRRKTGTETE